MLLAFFFVRLLRFHGSKLQNDYRTQLGTWPSSVLRYRQVCFTHCGFCTVSTDVSTLNERDKQHVSILLKMG